MGVHSSSPSGATCLKVCAQGGFVPTAAERAVQEQRWSVNRL